MSFREKSAWVTLITLLVLSLIFLSQAPWPWSLAPAPSGSMFHLLLLSIATFVAIEIVAHVVIAVFAPRDARTPKDERERLIELKSRAIAFHVYAATSLGSTFIALHIVGTNAIGLSYLLLFSFVAAEIVNYGLRIYHYRSGS